MMEGQEFLNKLQEMLKAKGSNGWEDITLKSKDMKFTETLTLSNKEVIFNLLELFRIVFTKIDPAKKMTMVISYDPDEPTMFLFFRKDLQEEKETRQETIEKSFNEIWEKNSMDQARKEFL